MLNAPDNSSNGTNLNISDLTIGAKQTIKVGQLGWGVEPSSPTARKLWGNTDGELTVTAWDGKSIAFTVTNASMIPLPGAAGNGAKGTFKLEMEIKGNILDF